MSLNTDRETPPTGWPGVGDWPIATVDAELGIYMAPMRTAHDKESAVIWHWCPTNHSGTPRWICMGCSNHTVESQDPWHLEPSILCPTCGLHGWVRNGRWQRA